MTKTQPQKQEPPAITLTGTIEEIVFSNPDTGYVVMELDTGTQLVTAVGEIPGVAAGEEVSLTGRYGTHPVYGLQFKAEVCERCMPATSGAILKYLCSGVIKGIGPTLARRVVDAFGDKTLEVIENEHQKLSLVRGISAAKADDIFEQYRHIFGIRTVMLYLSRFAIDAAASIRVWKLWGTLTRQIVEENPYILCTEAVGVPFAKADEIAALNMDIHPYDPRRLKAGLYHVLSHNLQNGHTCLPKDKLLSTASVMLGAADTELLEQALEESCRSAELTEASFGGKPCVYLTGLYDAEVFIAGRISLMVKNAPAVPEDLSGEISKLEERLGIRYDKLQKKAIDMALQGGALILTGGPGTGKTTTLNAIISSLEERGEKVALAAPTGRAAKRISEVTGRDASTVHRLLEVDFRNPETGALRFKRDEKNPLRVSTVILDEVSMVDIPLMYSLLKAIRLNCRLILVGDPDQLPSVGPGNILRDLIASDVVPCVHLNRVFRQAQNSAIVRNAHLIVGGEKPDLTSRDGDFFFIEKHSYQATAKTLIELCAERLPKAYGYSSLWDIQVIAPSRVGALGSVELNRILQQKLNPQDSMKAQFFYGSTVLREGDKVMQVKNNYDIPWKREDGASGAGVFNGDIGVIEMIDRPSQTLLIRYDDRVAQYSVDMAGELEHAWAITVHKSQGSEFEAVIMPLMSYHSKLYYRNILYTAVTRAKKLLIILGRRDVVFQMAANDRKVLRYTRLARLLEREVLGDG